MPEPLVTRSPEETRAVAAGLGAQLGPGSVLALHGDLGAGKTCFVQGLAEALGIETPVTSPTYTLIQEYPSDPPLYHVDLYRIGGAAEACGLGLEEYLEGPGITAVEWAERAAELLPRHTLQVHFRNGVDEDERIITIVRPAS